MAEDNATPSPVIYAESALQLLQETVERPIIMLAAPRASGKSQILDQIAKICAEEDRSSIRLNGKYLEKKDNAVERWRGFLLIDDAEFVPLHKLKKLMEEAVLNRGMASLIISCNKTIKISVSVLKLQGHLKMIGLADLALSPFEARVLANVSAADALSPAFQHMMRKTRGWMGAWQLIADQIKMGRSLNEISRGMDNNHSVLDGYYEDEIIKTLPSTLRKFITSVGTIWPLTDDLANHLYDDGASLLLQAHEHCAFLGIAEGGSRPHPLFAQFLLARARRQAPEMFRQTCLSAAAWFERTEEWSRAAEYLVAAGAASQAAHMLERNAEAIFARFGDTMLLDNSSAVKREDGLIPGRPDTKAIKALIDGKFVRGAVVAEGGEKGSEFAIVLQKFGTDDFAGVRIAANQWLSLGGGQALHRSTVAACLAVAHHADLELVKMRESLEQATKEAIAADSDFMRAWIGINWATYYCEMGRVRMAHEALMAVLEPGTARGMVKNTLEVMLAHVEWLLGRTDVASRLISRSLEPATRHAIPNTMVAGWLTAAHCIIAEEGLDSALQLLRRMRDVVSRRTGDRSGLLLRIHEVHLCLRHDVTNRLGEAKEEFEQIQKLALGRNLGRLFGEELRLLAARIMLASGDLKDATSLIQPILQRSRSTNRGKRWTEAMLIRIGIAIAQGDIDEAARLFWISEKGIGQERAIPRLILEEAKLLEPLIPTLRTQSLHQGFEAFQRQLIIDLARTAEVPLVSTPESVSSALYFPEYITAMEGRVLSLVEAGLSNAQIGDNLAVSELTVKWHLRNIFKKLGVPSRTAALARLRSI